MTYSPVPRDDPDEQRLTGPVPDNRPDPVSQKVRCRLAVGSGPGFTHEMACLLRVRLRLAILIILVGFALHFLRNLFQQETAFDHRPLYLLFCGCEIAVMVIASALLWSRRPLSMNALRILELTIFGSIAAFFGWLQVDTYHDGALLRAIVPGHEAFVFRLAGLSAALRWFLLIVLYGTFIPNAWQRCAAIVGSLALLPVIMMIAVALSSWLPAIIIITGSNARLPTMAAHRC